MASQADVPPVTPRVKGQYALLEALDRADLRDPIKWTTELIFLVIASYFAGAVGLHLSWVVISLFVIYYVRKKRHTRLLKRVRHAEALRLIVDIDEEKSILLRYVMKTLWSHYERMLSEWVASLLQPLLDGTKPAFLDSIQITQLSFGDQEPLIKSVKTHETKDDDHIVFDLDLSFVGQAYLMADLQYRGGKLVGGLSKIPVVVGLEEFSTKLRLEFRLMDKSPWIATLDLGFVGNPKVDMTLRPLKSVDLMEFPGLSRWLNDLVSNSLCGLMVLPKTATINIGGDSVETTDEVENEKQTSCVGVFQVTIFEAKNLPRSDLTFGLPSPYCKVVFGRRTYRTKAVKKSRNPVWNETHEFFVKQDHPPLLKVKLYDRSKLLMDTFIGGARLDMKPILASQRTATWDTTVTMGGKITLHLRCVYRPMSNDAPLSPVMDFVLDEFAGTEEVDRSSGRSSARNSPVPMEGATVGAGSAVTWPDAGPAVTPDDGEDSDEDLGHTPLFTPRKSVRNLHIGSPQFSAANFGQALMARQRSSSSWATSRTSRSKTFSGGDLNFAGIPATRVDSSESVASGDEDEIVEKNRDRVRRRSSIMTPTKTRMEFMLLKTDKQRKKAAKFDADSLVDGFNLEEEPPKLSMPGRSKKEPGSDGKAPLLKTNSVPMEIQEQEVSCGDRSRTTSVATAGTTILPSNPISMFRNPLGTVRSLSQRRVSISSTTGDALNPRSNMASVCAKGTSTVEGPAAASTGVLYVRVFEAQDLPKGSNGVYYVKFKMGAQLQTSSMSKKGKPTWNDEVEFFAKDLSTEKIVISVYEKNQFKADDMLGQVDMDTWWSVDGLTHDMWLEVKKIRLHLEVIYRPYNSKAKPSALKPVSE